MALDDYDVASGTFAPVAPTPVPEVPTADPAFPPPFETRETTDRGGLPKLPPGFEPMSTLRPGGKPLEPAYAFNEEAPLEDWAWLDVPTAMMIGALRIKRGFNALGRTITADNSDYAKEYAAYEDRQLQALEEHFSRGMQQRMEAPLFSERGFTFGRMVGEAGEMAPALFAAAAPGGVIGGTLGMITTAVINGTMTAGDAAAEMHKRLDPLTVEQWQPSPLFQKYLTEGKSPEEARKLALNDMTATATIEMFGVGTVTGAAGGPGLLAAGAPKRFAESALGKLAYIALTGYGTGSAQSGLGTQMIASAETALKLPATVDVAQAYLEGGFMGLITALPAMLHRSPHATPPRPDATAGTADTAHTGATNDASIDAAAQAALAAAKPPSAPAPGATASTTPTPATGAGAGDQRGALQQQVTDLTNAIDSQASMGADTTALEARRTELLDQIKTLPATPVPGGEAPPGATSDIPPVGAVPPGETLTPGETPPPPPPPTEVAGAPPTPDTTGSNVPPVVEGEPPVVTAPIPPDATAPVEGAPPVVTAGVEGAPPLETNATPPNPPSETLAPTTRTPRTTAEEPPLLPGSEVGQEVGQKGAAAIAVGKKPRVLKSEMTPENRAIAEAQTKERRATQQRLRRAKAAEERAAAAVEGTQPRAPTRKGAEKDAALAERPNKLLAVHADGDTGSITLPKNPTPADIAALKERIGPLAQAVRAATEETGGPMKRVSKVAHGVEAFAADTVALHNALDDPNRSHDSQVRQAKEYVGRLKSAEGGDFSHWKTVRKAAADRTLKPRGEEEGGSAKVVGEEGDTGKKVGVGRGRGQSGKFVPVEAKPGTKLEPGTPAFEAAAAAALKKTGGAKTTPGKAGTTAGKTEAPAPREKKPITVTKTAAVEEALARRKAGRKAEVVEHPEPTPVDREAIKAAAEPPAKPKEPAPQSHAAQDKRLTAAVEAVGKARDRLEKAKGKGAEGAARGQLAQAERQVRITQAKIELEGKLAETKLNRKNLTASQADIRRARDDLQKYDNATLEDMATDPAVSPEQLAEAIDRRANAHAVLEVEDTGFQPSRGPRATPEPEVKPDKPIVHLSEAATSNARIVPEGRTNPLGVIKLIMARLARSEKLATAPGMPEATVSHSVVDHNGRVTHYKSVFDTTVGALVDQINLHNLSGYLFGTGYGGHASAEVVRLLRQLTDKARDLPVHFLDQWRDGPGLDKEEFMGLYGPSYDDSSPARIIFNLDQLRRAERLTNGPGFGADLQLHSTILHEVLHHLTFDAYEAGGAFKTAVDRLYNHTKVMLAGNPDLLKMYGFDTPHEFIVEAFSNPDFHALLRQIEAPVDMVRGLGLDRASPRPSVMDAFIAHLVKAVRWVKGVRSSTQHSVFDALARAVDTATENQLPRRAPRDTGSGFHLAITDRIRAVGDLSRRTIEHVLDHPQPAGEMNKIRWLGLATTDYIARAADRVFGHDTNPIRAVARAFERIRVDSARGLDAAMPLVDRMFKAERAVGREQWTEFANFLADERHAGMHADKALTDPIHKYLSKNGLRDVQGKERHAALHARWQALPQLLKDLRRDLGRHYTQEQNKTTFVTIRNRLLRTAGIELNAEGEALANRIFLDRMTEADEALLGDLAGPIKNSNMLKKINGPYYPAMRRGDHVVSGTYRIEPPNPSTGATQVRDADGALTSVWEFGAGGNANKAAARKAAIDYAKRLPQHAEVKSVWVDEKTGSIYQEGDDVPVGQRVMKADPNSDHRFRVEVQDQHVEFMFNRKVANRRRNELIASGAMAHVDNVRLRQDEQFPRSGYLGSQLRTLQSSLERRPGWRGMTQAMQHDLTEALREASMRLYSSTRIESRSLPFRYVAGAGHEITKDLLDYSRASSARLAQLTHAPALDAALEQMNAMAGDQHAQVYGRSAFAREINKRAASPDAMGAGKHSPFVNRLMGLSFSTNLASPSYTLINLTQTPMLTFPILAARHGAFRAARELQKGYGLIGAGRQLAKGGRETLKAIAGKRGDIDYLTDIKARLASHPELVQLLDRAVEAGALDPEVGLEVAGPVDRSNPATPGGELLNAADSALNYIGTFARHLPRAAEVINRAPALIASYRLERTRGASHDAAIEYAIDVANQTQFNYASSNKAPIFNKPAMRLLTQFKQYPIHVMQIFAENAAKWWHNTETGDRAEAARAMAYILGTHAAFAGALGLPTEPFKLALVTLGMLGLPVPTWQEVEGSVREAAANAFGPLGGRIFSLGPLAALGANISPNVGLQNLLTYGGPLSYSWKDTTEWILSQMLGSPLSQGEKYIKGAQAIGNGDWLEAGKNFSPVKGLTNALDAGGRLLFGKVNVHGRETAPPYGIGEALVRATGLQTTADTERRAAQGLFFRETQKYQTERGALMDEWATADPSTRAKMFQHVLEWNKGRPRDEQLTRPQLDDYARRRQREESIGGTRIGSPVQRRRREQLQSVYGQ